MLNIQNTTYQIFIHNLRGTTCSLRQYELKVPNVESYFFCWEIFLDTSLLWGQQRGYIGRQPTKNPRCSIPTPYVETTGTLTHSFPVLAALALCGGPLPDRMKLEKFHPICHQEGCAEIQRAPSRGLYIMGGDVHRVRRQSPDMGVKGGRGGASSDARLSYCGLGCGL